MTICGARSNADANPDAITCSAAFPDKKCACGAVVKAELEAALGEVARPLEVGRVRVPDSAREGAA